MSLLPKDTYVNANRALWAAAGSGGGGGLTSPAVVTPALNGTCSLAVESNDSAAATLTVSTTTGGADLGNASVAINGGTTTTLGVVSLGAGPALVNVAGGTAANATVNIQTQAGNIANTAQLIMGPPGSAMTVACNYQGNLSFTTGAANTLMSINNLTSTVAVSGLTLVDGVVPGAITGQNKFSGALNGGAPAAGTGYSLLVPGGSAPNVGWWCYSIGTSSSDPISCQSCVSTMAYWNGTKFTQGGNVSQILNLSGGGTSPTNCAQIYQQPGGGALVFFYASSVTSPLVGMNFTATQMTGVVAGF